jgi:hypothetical protein
MKRSLKEPFGKAGLTVAILALVMALVGGAYAAGGLTKSQEKQVTKIAKKYAGKPGAAGAVGPVGAAGKDGTNGTNGTNGAPGEGVKITESAAAFPSGNCNGTTKGGKGGSKFEVGSTTAYACNGKEGTFGGQTLPTGKSLTGLWALSGYGAAGPPPAAGYGAAEGAVSFALPLATQIESSNVHFIKSGETPLPAGCTGSETEPGAEPGNLCVFGEDEMNAFFPQVTDVQENGFRVHAYSAGAGSIVMGGSWAVTAE